MEKFTNYFSAKNPAAKVWKYVTGHLSAKTVSALLVLVLIFDGIIVPMQLSIFEPFQPEIAFAADTIPPTGSVVIDGGATYANSTAVTLDLSSATDTGSPASGLDQVMVSENQDFSGASWQSYAASIPFTLSNGDGPKTVYVKYKDVAGNESSGNWNQTDWVGGSGQANWSNPTMYSSDDGTNLDSTNAGQLRPTTNAQSETVNINETKTSGDTTETIRAWATQVRATWSWDLKWQSFCPCYGDVGKLVVNGSSVVSYTGAATGSSSPTGWYSGNTIKANMWNRVYGGGSVTLTSVEFQGSSYNSPATLTSSVKDNSTTNVKYTTLDYAPDSQPSGGTLAVDVRGGNVATPDGSWTGWTTVADGGSLSVYDGLRYIQYKATLTSDGSANTTMTDITLSADFADDITLDATKPADISNFSAKDQVGGTTLTTNNWYNYFQASTKPYFSWDANVDADLDATNPYKVYFGTNVSATAAVDGSFQTATNYAPSSLTSGNTYYLKVVAKDFAGNFSNTEASFIYKYDADPPSDPSALNITPASTTQLDIGWTASTDSASGIADYRVERAPDSGGSPGSFSQVGTSGTNSYSDSPLTANTKYWYKVRTFDNVGLNSSYTSNLSKVTLSDAPATPSATDGMLVDQVQISWSASATADHYHVYKDGIAGSGTLIYNSTGTSTTDTVLDDSTHTYYIYSANSEDANSASYISDTGYRMGAPSAPTIGSASALSTTSVRWNFTDNASNEIGFKIHDASHSTMAADATINLGYIDETGLSANTQYTRHAHAYNGAGDSSGSSTASKYTLSATPNVTSDKTASTWYNTTDVIFTNAAGFGAAGVQYYRYVFDQNATHTWTDTETQWSASTLSRTASANGSWYLHVKAFNGEDVANGTATYGPFYYDGTDPTDPSGLVLTAASVSQIDLSWTGSTDSGGSSLTGYKVDRAPDSGGSPGTFAEIATPATNLYNSTSLTSNAKYWYRVRSYDGASNNSGYLANASKVTLSDPPTLPVATDNTYTTKIDVSWTASVTADHYHVYRDGVSGSGTLIHNTSATSFDDTITGSHIYYIYSVNSEDGENSGYISDTGVTNPVPSAPTIGSATALSSSSIQWSFTDNADNETGFKVHNGSDNTVASVTSVNASSITETGLSANTQYTRHIHAYNGAGDSSASTSVSKYTLAADPAVAASVDTSNWYKDSSMDFTTTVGFGAGGISHYRYIFSRTTAAAVSSVDSLWNSGALTLPINTTGTYYLHIKGYNSDNVATSQARFGPYHFDLEKPKVKIISHKSGDYVKGKITLEAEVSDNIGLADVGFYDNSLSNKISSSSTAQLDTTKTSNGERTIYAQVKDYTGSTTAHIIAINVDNIKPKAPIPADKGKGKDKNKDKVTEVKKGKIVRIYFKVSESASRVSINIKVQKRKNRKNFKQRLHKVLKIIPKRRALRSLYHKTKHKKDRKSRIRTRLFKRQIISWNKQIRKNQPYRMMTLKNRNTRVSTKKRVHVSYRPKSKGLYRIYIKVYDKANNTSKPLARWIRVK